MKSFVATFCRYSHLLRDSRLLWPILAISLILNLWGIHWGAPKFWHPDEITDRTISMVAARSINPHYFAYGASQFYVVGAVAVIPVYLHGLLFDPPPPREDSLARSRWWQPRITRMVVIARAISAVMSTAVVMLTFIMAKMLFDKSPAYLAALFLSVSMSFVAVAHFATVDSPANFWYWLSCLFALLIWKRGDHIWYALAAITAGFAIGIKVDRVVILLPLLLSHYLRGDGLRFRKLITFAILLPVGYFISNPTLFTSTFEFLDGFARNMFYQALREGPEQSSYIQVLHDMKSSVGLPLFLAAASGLAYGFYNLALNRNGAAVVWLLSTFLPYYLIFGGTSVQYWYLPFFFPALMILAAQACMTLIGALPQRYALVAKSTVAGIALYSFIYAIALIVQFSNDSRYLAADWIERNVPVNATIEIGERGPIISQDKYKIINSLRDPESMGFARNNREKLEDYRPYQKIRQVILDLEKWAGQNFGFQVRKQTYVDWFDNPAQSDKASAEGLQRIVHQPECIVLIEDLYPQKVSSLMLPDSGYRLAARPQFVVPLGLRPEFPFVNPPVYIFQRMAPN